MPSKLQSLGLDRLSVDEKLELIEAIWETIAAEPDKLPVPEEHLVELQRRLDAFAVDGDPGRPAKEVIADVRRRLQ